MAYVKENKSELTALFTRIANQLAAELRGGWTHVCLGFFVDANDREDMLIYVSLDNGNNWRDFMDDVFESENIMVGVFECKESCRQLYAHCAKTGDKWTNFTLLFDSEGYSRTEFSYDPMEKFTPVMKAMWMGKYLE